MHHIHMSYTQPGPDSHTSESMHFVLLPNRKRQEKVKSHVSVSTFSHMLYLFRAWVPTNLSVILPTWRDALPRILEGSVVIYGEMLLCWHVYTT